MISDRLAFCDRCFGNQMHRYDRTINGVDVFACSVCHPRSVAQSSLPSSDGGVEGHATDGAPSKRTAPVARPDRGAGVEPGPSEAPPAPAGEPVAYTNDNQLGYLKSEAWRESPMAMWAYSAASHDVPLYASPQQSGQKAADEEQADLDALIEEYAEISRIVGRRGTEDVKLSDQVRAALQTHNRSPGGMETKT